MTDITTTNLEAAIIDQNVAGAFHDKAYAFIIVAANNGWGLAVAVANEEGYNPIPGKVFHSQLVAEEYARRMNEHIGVNMDTEMKIVVSTMGGRPYVAS